MALIYSSTNNFWIKPNALNIGLNHLENPNLIEASLLAGAVIMAYKEDVIPFNAAHNYRTWQLNASRTFLEKNGKCYVYARLDRNESSNLAQIIYSYEQRDMLGTTVNEDGTTDNVTDPAHYYILLGVLSAAIDDDGNSVPRVWEEGLYSGSLATDQYIQEESGGDLKKMFRLNSVTNLIDVLLGISAATINVLTVAKSFILGGKTITGVADSPSSATPSDTDLTTSAYVDTNTLSSKSDDVAKGHITFEKGLTVKKKINLDSQDITGVDVESDVPDGGIDDAEDNSIPTTAAMVKHTQKYGDANYLSKNHDDVAKGKITFKSQQQFEKGLKVGNFTPGVSDGTGGAMEVRDGNVHLTTDYLNVRRKARFNEVEILTTHYIGGAQMSSAASCKIDFVETVMSGDTVSGYRCYFRKIDTDGRIITNDWIVGDQAYCNTFNLQKQADGTTGNHYYWRFVSYCGVNEGVVTGDDGEKYNGNEYHYILLSAPRCAVGSDVPQVGDEVVLLGHQPQSGESEADYAGRQSAIYQVASGTDGRPYYRQYVGINSFTLDGCLEQQFMPGDNIFSGKVNIKGGSGMKNFDDYEEVIKDIESSIGGNVDVQFSNSNLLVNSGFYGDAKSLDIDLGTTMNVDTEMFSPSLLNWVNNNAVVESNEDNTSIKDSLSGFVCVLDNGSIAQQLGTAVKDESYVFSLRAIGSFSLSFAGYSETFEVTDSSARKVVKFKAQSTTKIPILTISGTGAMCELMLERGTITSATWARSVLDVTPEASRLQNLQYLANAIREGSTDILGGLILSNIIMLGNYVDGKMKQVTSGISGTYNQDNDVSFWAGGTLEGAIQAVAKFVANPFYEPTPEETASFAKAIITHGGKAILQDAIVKGNIYADNGIFKGEVNATSGTFVNGKFDNVVINGAYNRLVISITPQNSHEYIYSTNGINHALLLKWGDVVYLDEDYSGEITFPYLEPVYNDGTLSYTGELGWKIDHGQIVRMEESDVRSLVGRQIAIYGRKINGDGININCGMHKEVFASDTQTEGYTISNPYSENTTLYNWTDSQAKVASLGLTIATCILAQKHYTNINGVPSSAEMITWSIQYMPMMNGSVDTALAYFWYKIDGTDEQFEFKFYDGWTWAQFVKSQFNDNEAFVIESDGKVIYVIGENESLDVYKYFGSGDSVYANDKIENGITYSNTYTE